MGEWARELRRELRIEWAELWRSKYDDEVKAEGVTRREFVRLFVDEGEVIVATRDFKPLSFREVYERHVGSDVAVRVEPDPAVGGWGKFVRENLSRPRPVGRERPGVKVDLSQHQRGGGYGWRNVARIRRKMRQGSYGH